MMLLGVPLTPEEIAEEWQHCMGESGNIYALIMNDYVYFRQMHNI